MVVESSVQSWLLESDEPWTRFRTRLDLLDQDLNHPDVKKDRQEMVDDPQVQELIYKAASWPGGPLKRHNDAKHPLQTLTVLADFGIMGTDPGMKEVIGKITSQQSPEGAFETHLQLYKRFGGIDGVHWTWMGCDAPILVFVLASFGLMEDPAYQKAREHLLSLARETGWPCSSSPLLGNFKGPGKRKDPCPIATLQALKAISLDSEDNSEITQAGIDMLLDHWDQKGKTKYYLFGIGTDFQKLKYPLVWYDILHVGDVLSRFPAAIKDSRYQDMIQVILEQGDEAGRWTASSMYMAWKGWSFADKKEPSPWLTFLVERIRKRAGM